MNKKIEFIRKYLELSETQISSLLNISSYKYKRFENGTIELSIENIILLSIMFDVQTDYLVLSKYSVEEIIVLPSIVELKKQNLEFRLSSIEKCICSHCSFACDSVNYRVIKNITKQYTVKFSKNLYFMRTNKAMEINTISEILRVKPKEYLLFEQGKALPNLFVLIDLTIIFNTSIENMFFQ